MKIIALTPHANMTLSIVAEDGRRGDFDAQPYLHLEAFAALHNPDEFLKVRNGGYFVEWDCGADLSADTIEAQMKEVVSEPLE